MNVQSKKFMSNHAADMVMDVKMLLGGGDCKDGKKGVIKKIFAGAENTYLEQMGKKLKAKILL